VAGAGLRRLGSGGPRALFAGLCTLDIIQGVTRMPGRNEKVTAQRQAVAAGGPATNAAVTFAFLGGQATLLTGVGGHPLTRGMLVDLQHAGVTLIDAAAGDDAPPAVSSIIVTEGAGDRCVVSTNAADLCLQPPSTLDALVAAADVVLIDGHHPAVALAVARLARTRGRPCILDGGSWKPHTPDLLPHVDIAICSADFRPPSWPSGSPRGADVLDALLDAGVPWAAVTDGPRPVRWASGDGARGASGDGARAASAGGASAGGASAGGASAGGASAGGASAGGASAGGASAGGASAGGASAGGASAGGVRGEVPVPPVDAADTLGAGDVFHGAFAHAIAGAGAVDPESFSSALRFAACVAAHSCRSFGTRSWMTSWPPSDLLAFAGYSRCNTASCTAAILPLAPPRPDYCEYFSSHEELYPL
jgi:sugar/nucleoside kinase (ribokinase family)